MGIYDREYYQETRRGSRFGRITGSAVGVIIAINVVVWVLQLLFAGQAGGGLTEALTASPGTVFDEWQVWRLLTANFAHSTRGLMHLAGNMLILFFFGRDIERLYGRRDFWIFYLGCGVIALLAELILLRANGQPNPVLGASGATIGVFVVFALTYPTRTVLFSLLIPVPVWILCVLYILVDVMGALGPDNGVANLAHLAGALCGFLFHHFDLRWTRIRDVFGGGRRRRGKAQVIRGRFRPARTAPPPDARSAAPPPAPNPETLKISGRIDALLAKISTEGQGSLSEEELEFLKENSGRYRSS